MWFTSDNASGAAPEIMAAVARANDGYARSYGADALMDKVRDQLRDLFEAPEAAVFLVTTGTVANALSLALLTPPWGAVFCHTHAHIAEDECGAPEFYTSGAKLVLVGGAQGRMEPEALEAAPEVIVTAGPYRLIGSPIGVDGYRPQFIPPPVLDEYSARPAPSSPSSPSSPSQSS